MQLVRNLRLYPLFQNDGFPRRILALAIPIMFQQMFVNLVNLLDNLMVGQLGETAMSAVAAANKYNMIGLFAINGVGVAAGVYISQFYGAKEEERVRESYHFSLLASALIVILLVLPGLLIPDKIGLFFVHDESVVQPIKDYFPMAVLSFVPQIYSFATQNAMRTLGESRKSLYLSLVAVLSNVVFNYIFIFGHLGAPALGVKGAALGSLLARTCELIATRLMVRKYRFIFSGHLRQVFTIHPAVTKAITRKALPLVINEIGYSSGMALLFKFYGTRGKQVLAAMAIMSTCSELFFAIFAGIAVATMVVVGQPLGANQLEEARSNAYRLYKMGLLFAGVFSLLMLASSFVMPEFYAVSAEVKGLAAYFLRLYAIFYVFYTISSLAYQILRAGGAMRQTMIMDAGFFWLVNLPVVGMVAYLTDWSIEIMFLCGQLTDIVKCFVSSHLLVKEEWVTNLAAGVKVD